MIPLILRGVSAAAGVAGFKLSGFAIGAIVAGLVTVAFASYSAWIFRAGAERAELRCEAATLRAKLAAQSVDLNAARVAAEEAQKARDESIARAEQATKRLQGIEDHAKNHPVAGCVASDTDVQLRQPAKAGRGSR